MRAVFIEVFMRKSFIRVTSIYGQMMALIIFLGSAEILFINIDLLYFSCFFISFLVVVEVFVYFFWGHKSSEGN